MIQFNLSQKSKIHSLPKDFWREVATKTFSVESNDLSTIRYFVEKIAEKIGVDDKISDDKQLKYEVYMKLKESSKESVEDVISAQSEDNNESLPANTELDSDLSESMDANIERLTKDTIDLEEEVEIIYSDIDALRAECQKLGVGYQLSDDEEMLMKQLFVSSKIHGTQLSVSIKDFTEEFNRVTGNSNDGIIPDSVSENQSPHFNHQNHQKQMSSKVHVDSKFMMLQFEKNICRVINAHFRNPTIEELNEMCIRENFPFNHEVIPCDGNTAYIMFKDLEENEQRVPLEGFFNVRD